MMASSIRLKLYLSTLFRFLIVPAHTSAADNAGEPDSGDRDMMARQVFADYQALRAESFRRVFSAGRILEAGAAGGIVEDEHQRQSQVTASEASAINRFLWATAVKDDEEHSRDRTRMGNESSSSDEDRRTSCVSLHTFLLSRLAELEETVLEAQDHEVKGFETVAWMMELSEESTDGEPRMRVPGLRVGGALTIASGNGKLEGQTALASPDYSILFGPLTTIVDQVQNFMQSVSYLIMTAPKECFASDVRNLLHAAFRYWRNAFMAYLDAQFWMVDLGMLSNSNSPKKHFRSVLNVLESAKKLVEMLVENLGPFLSRTEHFWGHNEVSGMFTNTTLLYRDLFPDTTLIDKGVLRVLLREGVRMVPEGQKIPVFDFGSMDGAYSRWLNDTGVFSATAIEGSPNADKIVSGVHFADLTVPLNDQLDASILRAAQGNAASIVLCIEVAEHIPPAREAVFLQNLKDFATLGLVLSWAPPHILGEGHVNCKEESDSKALIESLGFERDEGITAQMRRDSTLSWVKESVAFYWRRS
ncbi:unnamed protein product [Amoebophrya sp. A25]|nr:unnamed protein product [Amoebophrya sp. A25]|eukprot:GSA25T00025857001.1